MICSSWDIEQNILKFFALLSPLKSCKNQNFEKWQKLLEISSFYTCVPKITITWCIVPEIRSETDRIVCHFRPFFALLPSPLPLMIPKIKILKKKKKKMKKMPGDIIVLQINDKCVPWMKIIWYIVPEI